MEAALQQDTAIADTLSIELRYGHQQAHLAWKKRQSQLDSSIPLSDGEGVRYLLA